MATSPTDARIRELQFLAKLDQDPAGSLDLPRTDDLDPRDRSMIIQLIEDDMLNGPSTRTMPYGRDFIDNRSGIFNVVEFERVDAMSRVMGSQRVQLRISHKGRVRLSELEQALRTGRDRDPTGTVISKRHLQKDLIIALVSARADSPVTICMLDMNGMKQINDTIDHAAGDEAIETYLKTIAMFLGDEAEGYRGEGGDELVVVMRGTALPEATKVMEQALTQLAKEKVRGVPFLSASCGITATMDPNTDARDLLNRVDAIQKRAKSESKKRSPRPNVLAVNEQPVEVLPDPVPGVLQYMKEEAAKKG